MWNQCKARRPLPLYEIDQILWEWGHTVIRTPPYHPEYQSIELVWADVKRWLGPAGRGRAAGGSGSNNRLANTFKISDLRAGDLTVRALAQVTPEKCKSYVDKCRATAAADAERDRLLDVEEEHSLIINFSSDSDESSSETSD